jgi:ATP-binding cassette subfamily C protein CydCD
VAAWFLPVAGAWVAALGFGAGALAWAAARFGTARPAADTVAARALVSRRVVALLDSARPLLQWQVHRRALAEVDAAGDRGDSAAVRTAGWSGAARAWPLVAAGAGVGLLDAATAPVLTDGGVSGPVVALLVLLPLALADVAGPVADAGALRVSTAAAAARLEALHEAVPAVVDPLEPAPLPGDSRVALDRVRAAWEADEVVGPVSLDLSPGRRVGVVGPSGCGKSTLAAVLVRFLAPTGGTHRIGTTNVADLAADDVRRVTGLLDDDPYLFSSTLAENVRLARPDATDTEVADALRRARLGPWLDGLPDGLATRLGDGGGAVSGGERARIGIARLLLAEHPVLVLDEPTAHLDSDTARTVADEVLSLPGRSVVWITHGTVGLDRMDDVLALDAGGVRQEWAAAP